ncbi:hypothetical protein Dimus_008593 [Dionaea muscipula]
MMNPTAMFPFSAGGGGGGGGGSTDITSQRIFVCAERLGLSAQSAQRDDVHLFFNQCLSLARGIDSALAANNVPREVAKLPPIIKQVCNHKNEFVLQAAIMVLMLSVKNACKSGWFSSKDAEELLTLANEISSCFYHMGDITTEPTSFLHVVSHIMSRFYPQYMLGQILLAFEIKPGYASYIEDFQISKDIRYPPHEKMRLFVAQKDNTDTSACIINPPNVNFLINGKGVEKRTNVMMDPGPQLPTIVNSYLKYGTNLLQAVGQCEGHYIVLVAFMNTVPSSELLAVQDYVQPVGTTFDIDSDIIEGASRISLNCPISCKRIKTPVKGHMCRHHQCFDLSNYLEINSRRPSWRCPCCNQSACYPEIRVDQSMFKILKELGDNAVDVIISADGSWKAASKTKDSNEPQDSALNSPSEEPGIQHDSCTSIAPSNVCDLTEGDEEMATADPCVQVDNKPKVISGLQSQSTSINPTVSPASSNISDINYSSGTQIDGVWSPRFRSPSGLANGTTRPVSQATTGPSQSSSFMSPSGPTNYSTRPVWQPVTGASLPSPANFLPPSLPANSATRLVSQLIAGESQPSPASFVLPSRPKTYATSLVSFVPQPVLTDAVSPASNREFEAFQGTNHAKSPILSQIPAAHGSGSIPSQFSQSVVGSEYARSPAIPRNVTRIPTAIQALPVQMPTSGSSQQLITPFGRPPTTESSPSIQSSPLPASVVNSASGKSMERHQNAAHSYANPLQIPDMGHSFLQRTPNVEMLGVTAPVPFPNSTYRVVSSGTQTGHQQPLNLRTPQTVSMPPHLMRSSYAQRIQGGQLGTAPAGIGHHMQLLAAAQRTAALVQRHSPAVSLHGHAPGAATSSMSMNTEGSRTTGVTNTTGTVQSVTRTENLIDLQSEQSWRPTGRMRGSLTGRAYSAALSQLMIQPTEQSQATAPPSNLSTPPHLQATIANSRNAAQASQIANPPTTTSS